MAEALRSALEVSERPASSYYEMSDRAEGQPTLNPNYRERDYKRDRKIAFLIGYDLMDRLPMNWNPWLLIRDHQL